MLSMLCWVVLSLSCFILAATWSPTTVVAVVATCAHTNKSNKFILSPRCKSRELVLHFFLLFFFGFLAKRGLELCLLLLQHIL